ncbi:hypothetical protein AB1I63_09730 [Streptococcus pneumoniae]
MSETTLKVDQFTLMLHASESEALEDLNEWSYIAEHVIAEFIRLSSLDKLFEIKPQENMFPAGYTTGYTLADTPAYFSIAYHPLQPTMGVIVKFSAQAWTAYQEYTLKKFNQNIQLHHFLREIESDLYSSYLSRVDIAIDFFDEDIDIHQLRTSIEKGRTELRYGKYRKRNISSPSTDN